MTGTEPFSTADGSVRVHPAEGPPPARIFLNRPEQPQAAASIDRVLS